MKKWNIRGNVLRKWLLSYLLVLLAPLVGTVLTYTYTHQTLAREVAAATGLNKNELYNAALRLEKE